MRRIIGGLAAMAVLFVVASCGGVSEGELVGKWSPDPSSLKLELGKDVPAEMKAMATMVEAQAGSDEAAEIGDATLEFKEGGKLVLSAEGESQNGTWSLDGENLTLGMEQDGLKVELTVQVEMDGDKMTATLQATEILKAIKKVAKQQPGAEDMIKSMTGNTDLEKAAKGTSMSISFKKK